MLCRISGSAWLKIRLTTLAGISSIRSTASSTYNSSTTSFNSVSENPWISSCWASGSISTNVSAACSLGSSRNSSGSRSSGSASNSAATSDGFIVTRISRSVKYFFSSNNKAMVRSIVLVYSAISSSCVL